MRGPGALLTGPFRPALESALVADLHDHASRDPLAPAIVVVPTNFLAMRLSRQAASAGLGGHANVRFLTLKDLAARLAPLPLPGGRAPLPAGGDLIVVRRILESGAAAGGHFAAIADRPGFARALLSSIQDLKEACYTPDALEEAARKAGLLKRGRPGKLAELVRLWRLYEAFLEKDGWADVHDLMAAASTEVEGGRAAPLPPLFVYGFYDLNALQKRLIAACWRGAGARVYFPWLDLPCFRYAEPTLRWFESLGLALARVGPADAVPAGTPETQPRETPLPPTTLFLSAPGEAREAREGVRILVRILEERGLPFQDVGILLRAPDAHGDLFAEELTRLDAKPYLESPCPLARSRAGRSLLKLADAVASDFGRIEVMEFLSVADLAPGDGSEPPVSDWNKASILAGIVSGAGSWVPALEKLAGAIEASRPDGSFREEHGHLATPIRSLIRLLSELIPPLAGLPKRAAPAVFLDELERVFVHLTRDDGRGDVLDAADALRALSPVAGSITFAEFAELLRSTLDVAGPKLERFGLGGPSVLSLMSARGLSFRAVVVPGLVEKLFPLPRRQDPILLDAERERLNNARGNDPLASFQDRAAGADEEELLFHLAVSAAEEVLVLSWPRLDPATARPRVASQFALRAMSELTGEPHDYEKLDTSPRVIRVPLGRRFPEERFDALTDAEFDGRSVLEALRTGDPSEVAYLAQADSPRRAGLAMEEARFGSPFFTTYDAAVTGEAAKEAVRTLAGLTRAGAEAGVAVSATSLEDYARCPFAFFMRHVLGIQPLEEPEEAAAPTPLERGELYHAVLDGFLKRARKAGRLPLSAGDLELLLATADDAVASGRWTFAARPGSRDLELLALRRNLSLWLWSEITGGSLFLPSYFEARFGGPARPGDDTELSLEEPVRFEAVGGVRVAFRGKIDRIDLDAKRRQALVIDYKTGSPGPSPKGIFDRGRMLQLPVYILAAQAMLDAAGIGARVDRAEYRYVTRSESRTARALSREDFESAGEALEKAVGLIVKGIADGMFFAWPEDNRCGSCDYRAACGTCSVVLALSRMKQGDRRAHFFTQGLVSIE